MQERFTLPLAACMVAVVKLPRGSALSVMALKAFRVLFAAVSVVFSVFARSSLFLKIKACSMSGHVFWSSSMVFLSASAWMLLLMFFSVSCMVVSVLSCWFSLF